MSYLIQYLPRACAPVRKLRGARVDEQILLNMAFRFGHHYVEVDRARRSVVPTPAPRDIVRRKIQKIRDIGLGSPFQEDEVDMELRERGVI